MSRSDAAPTDHDAAATAGGAASNGASAREVEVEGDSARGEDENGSDKKRPPERLFAALRRIFAFSRPYRRRLAGALVLASLVALVVPLGLRALIDAVFEESNARLLNRLTLGLVVLFLVQAVLSFFGYYLLAQGGLYRDLAAIQLGETLGA